MPFASSCVCCGHAARLDQFQYVLLPLCASYAHSLMLRTPTAVLWIFSNCDRTAIAVVSVVTICLGNCICSSWLVTAVSKAVMSVRQTSDALQLLLPNLSYSFLLPTKTAGGFLLLRVTCFFSWSCRSALCVLLLHLKALCAGKLRFDKSKAGASKTIAVHEMRSHGARLRHARSLHRVHCSQDIRTDLRRGLAEIKTDPHGAKSSALRQARSPRFDSSRAAYSPPKR